MRIEELKETLDIATVAERYGLAANRRGYISCPFHEEDTPSLKLYPDTNTFYCFGCGKGGDIIALAQGLFHLDFAQAVCRLKWDFGLLDGPEPDRREREKILKERREKARKLEAYRAGYETRLERCRDLLALERELRPGPGEEPRPAFLAAREELEWLNYWFAENPWK